MCVYVHARVCVCVCVLMFHPFLIATHKWQIQQHDLFIIANSFQDYNLLISNVFCIHLGHFVYSIIIICISRRVSSQNDKLALQNVPNFLFRLFDATK